MGSQDGEWDARVIPPVGFGLGWGFMNRWVITGLVSR